MPKDIHLARRMTYTNGSTRLFPWHSGKRSTDAAGQMDVPGHDGDTILQANNM